jgi:hypothetical protein
LSTTEVKYGLLAALETTLTYVERDGDKNYWDKDSISGLLRHAMKIVAEMPTDIPPTPEPQESVDAELLAAAKAVHQTFISDRTSTPNYILQIHNKLANAIARAEEATPPPAESINSELLGAVMQYALLIEKPSIITTGEQLRSSGDLAMSLEDLISRAQASAADGGFEDVDNAVCSI